MVLMTQTLIPWSFAYWVLGSFPYGVDSAGVLGTARNGEVPERRHCVAQSPWLEFPPGSTTNRFRPPRAQGETDIS